MDPMGYVTNPNNALLYIRYSPSNLPYMCCCLFDALEKKGPFFHDLWDQFLVYTLVNESQPAL